MADHPIRSTGTSQVPLGGRAVASISTTENGIDEDFNTIRVIWKDHLGATISDETWSGTDISTTATDGGAITITDPVGIGNYQATYAVPNDGTYTPPAAGLQFSVQIIATDEDGTADTGAIAFIVIPANVAVSLDSTSVTAVVKRRTGILEDVDFAVEDATKLPTNPATSRKAFDLARGAIYAIDEAYKNGTAIVRGTDYFWNTFGTRVEVTPAPADGDEYRFTVQLHMSNTVLNDYVQEAQDMTLMKLRGHYPSSVTLLDSPDVRALIAMRATGRILKFLQRGDALANPQFRSGMDLEKEWMDMMAGIRSGTMDISNAGGATIGRADGALVGGVVGPFEVTRRHHSVDLVQRWTNILQSFYPEGLSQTGLNSRRGF